MEKKIIQEILRIRELSGNNSKEILNEDLFSEIGDFLSKASEKILSLPAVKKLKDFYEKNTSSSNINTSVSSDVSNVDSTFTEITNKIIDNIEGGYYHPSFKIKGAKNRNGKYMSPASFAPMGDSGETMFGLDRKHGGTLNTSPDGIKFWSIIDNAQRNEGRWAYSYRGGQYEQTLRNLVSKILYDKYKKNSEKYLSPKSKKIVESNKKLLFQFAYATWNGTGYFQKFANSFNREVEKGVTDPLDLYDTIVAARQASGQGGRKIAKIDKVISNYA